ncbi:MAG: helix-turn-helix transcriptional regulator, partial [Candidatus Methanomethylophilaceae archaeon]|nr:helix-turn-helix transcriptional regulator [Candidatus Methanomethylophilaceae archaeon]
YLARYRKTIMVPPTSEAMDERERTSKVIDVYLSIFGNRWNLLILNELFNGPKRFNDLKRALDPITQSVLTRHLKALEEMDVIERKVMQGSPPSVYYAISREGFSVIPSMIASYNWIIEHVPELK